MAFSFRKMFSNIYFKKPDEDSKIDFKNVSLNPPNNTSVVINFERKESDTALLHTASLKLPESVKKFTEKKGSLSDTDLLTINFDTNKPQRRKCKKLKLDIKKARQSVQLSDDSFNVENTPKKMLLDGNISDEFSKRLKGFDFNKSFDLFDEISDGQSSTPYDEDIDLDSFSECSESDVPNESIKMCRKVCSDMHFGIRENQTILSSSSESFVDVNSDKSAEERLKLILNYQLKLEEIECLMKDLLRDYQFRIKISKTFKNISDSQKSLQDICIIGKSEGPSLAESWNLISAQEEDDMKYKLKKQLWSMKSYIEQFVHDNLEIYRTKKCIPCKRSVSSDLGQKQRNKSKKKKVKYFDYPDIRDAMINLFMENEEMDSADQCQCKCHEEIEFTQSTELNEESFSITSSIGNFSLDSSMLTVFSESLDQIISFSSFDSTSLYNTLLQIPAIDRIKFYVQVHSIEIKSKLEIESKGIHFYCPACKYSEAEEDGLLRHILSQSHCEKIHFLYKTAYIKKCVAIGKEIQPSTVLNPMTMYRDQNKIVCFGDAIYACTLCFENNIIGESILMAHCSESNHVDRRDKLVDIFN